MKQLTEEQKAAVHSAIDDVIKEYRNSAVFNSTIYYLFMKGIEEVLTNPEKYGLMAKPTYTAPCRVGRKQGRAVLDKDGIEIVIFPKGKEADAIEYCNFINSKEVNHEQ